MSKKVLDQNGRWRDKTIAFRISSEEDIDLNTRVKLSGLTKQDYIISRVLCRDVVVQGNPRVYKALRDSLKEISVKLEEGTPTDEVLGTINLIAITLNGLKED